MRISSHECTRAGCHDLAAAPSSDGKGTVTDPRHFRNAFHGPGNSCFSCHAEAQKAGKPGGPTACKDCHATPSPRWGAEAGGSAEPARPAEGDSAAPAMETAPQTGATTKETPQTPAPAERNGTR